MHEISWASTPHYCPHRCSRPGMSRVPLPTRAMHALLKMMNRSAISAFCRDNRTGASAAQQDVGVALVVSGSLRGKAWSLLIRGPCDGETPLQYVESMRSSAHTTLADGKVQGEVRYMYASDAAGVGLSVRRTKSGSRSTSVACSEHCPEDGTCSLTVRTLFTARSLARFAT